MQPEPKDTSSFLERQDQMELLPSSQMDDKLFDAEENPLDGKPREYTAARFFAKRPEEYRLIVSMLAEGHTMREIARRFVVGHRTIVRIQAREMGSALVATLKQGAARKFRALANIGADVLHEVLTHPDAVEAFKKSPEKLAIMIGILQEKAELLSGGATQRVEVVDQANSYRALLEHARQMMGCQGDVGGQKGVVPGPGADVAGCAPGAAHPVVDVESEIVSETVKTDKVSDDEHT